MNKYNAHIYSFWDIKFILFYRKQKKCTFFYAHNCVVFTDALNVVAYQIIRGSLQKIRWAVECVNGRKKSWKYFDKIVPQSDLHNIQSSLLIVAAFCNCYLPLLHVNTNKDCEIAKINASIVWQSKSFTKPCVVHYSSIMSFQSMDSNQGLLRVHTNLSEDVRG